MVFGEPYAEGKKQLLIQVYQCCQHLIQAVENFVNPSWLLKLRQKLFTIKKHSFSFQYFTYKCMLVLATSNTL